MTQNGGFKPGDSLRLCDDMLGILARQVADLRSALKLAEGQYSYWSEVRDTLQVGRLKIPPRRAVKGALRGAVLEILAEHGEGLTLGAIDAQVARRLATYNRHSLSEVLARLRASGKVVHSGDLWSTTREIDSTI